MNIINFLKGKKKSYPQLENDEWMKDPMPFTDINESSTNSQLSPLGKNKIISDFRYLSVFRIKVFSK